MIPRRKRSALLLALGLAALASAPGARAEPQSTDEQLATIAMYEDTRCPDGQSVAAYLADTFPPSVRLRACRALARLQDSTTVEALAGRLRSDQDPPVRAEAAFALGQIGSRQAYDVLRWACEDEKADVSVRAAVVEALGKLGDPRGIPVVMRALADADPAIRKEAAIALWRLGDKGNAPQLVRALHEADAEVRAMDVWALEKAVDPHTVIPELSKIAGDHSALVRSYVARTLGRQGTQAALEPLFRLLTDPDLHTRVNAARSLGQVGDSAAVPQLLAALDDVHPYVRETAVTSLGKLKTAAIGTRLAEMAKDKDPGVRAAVPAALAAILPPDEAWSALQTSLHDKSRRVRSRALEALGAVNKPEAIAALRQTFGTAGASPLERASAAGALGTLKATAAKSDLVRALGERDPGLSSSAADALGDLGDGGDDVVAALVTAIRTNASPNEPDVVVSGLAALGKLKAQAGVPVAEGLANSPTPVIRDAARGLLTAVLGDSVARQRIQALPAREWKGVSVAAYKNIQPSATTAEIRTVRGTIEIQLYPADAPHTVANFVTLARKGYFDKTRFHRIVPNFVVQDGDPTGTGWGGPGYAIRCEYNRHRYDIGAVGMALSGKDTGGSQYFITQSPQYHLDGRYTIFGHVTRGLPILDDLRLDDEIEKVTVR
ncbi:MAG TPA: HEAT repeat domain-containing protein [Candidatus Eisenbacteria bacterium]|nr:HEAT repeat domain-containing protein [Candidatus Eisenbacteria bacterium]